MLTELYKGLSTYSLIIIIFLPLKHAEQVIFAALNVVSSSFDQALQKPQTLHLSQGMAVCIQAEGEAKSKCKTKKSTEHFAVSVWK